MNAKAHQVVRQTLTHLAIIVSAIKTARHSGKVDILPELAGPRMPSSIMSPPIEVVVVGHKLIPLHAPVQMESQPRSAAESSLESVFVH
mmetsp:Transcript_61321/g.113857  ORF Transcript_61321/g.113857 Transcript_61321/m.113857 type:complete len:89 (+) Transcript_61321:96-362(+)